MARLVVFTLALLAVVCYGEAKRIVGGSETNIENYPYIVQVERQSFFTGWSQACAANILNELYVLSAAHCFEGGNYQPAYTRIRSGTTYRNEGGVITYIEQEFNHPSYREASRYDGDISVIRLASYLQFTDVVQPGTIAGPNAHIPDNTPVVHAGWGITTEAGSPSSVLLDTVIYTINHDLCRERYLTLPSPQVVTENMICAGLLDVGGRDACQGDSGGPLYYAYSSIIVGIVSWGHGCANETFPGINTAVSPYSEWIFSTAG